MLQATIKCLKKGGLEAASVRKIAAELGISVGLINHHFPSKEDLVAEAYSRVASELLDTAWQEAMSSGDNPREQLSGFFRGNFSEYPRDPGTLKTWMAFWSMSEQSPQVQAVHDELYRTFRGHLEQLLKNLCDDPGELSFDVRLAAIGLSALIDGLWLEQCLNPETFSPKEGILICESWVEGLVSGVFQHLER